MSVNAEQEPSKAPSRKLMLGMEVSALSGTHLTTILEPALYGTYSSRLLVLLPNVVLSCVSDLARLGLYLFVMFASGDTWASFGVRKRWRSSDTVALLVAIPIAAVIQFGYFSLRPSALAGLQLPHSYAGRAAPLSLLAINCLLIGVYEEVAYRGYLIPRLEELFGSTTHAVLIQALFFGLIHTYHGFPGMVSTALFGLAMGVIFTRCRSVWPLAITHALMDYVLMAMRIQTLS